MKISELHQRFLKSPNVCTDTRKIENDCIFFALKGEKFNGNEYAKEALKKGATLAVIDEEEYKEDDTTVLVPNVLEALQQLANYHRNHCTAKVIALTGSNGKTTTKELIHVVLSKKYSTIATKGNLNNHIGVPLTLLSIQDDTEIAIVEMGANHQKEIEFLSSLAQPDFGYITNFGKAHLEGFGGEEGVIKGKSELYTYLTENRKSVFINADDPIQVRKLSTYINKYGFSQNDHQYYKINFLGADPFVKLSFEDLVVESQMIGKYNFSNCCAAIVIGKYFNVPKEDIKDAIESYVPENNRSQIIEKNGHKIILDAYNANPTSMKAALENFDDMKAENKIAILGDMFELGDSAEEEHRKIAQLAASLPFEKVFLLGENFYRTESGNPKFTSFDTFKKYLESLQIPESTLLIKGSRGMALERVLDLI